MGGRGSSSGGGGGGGGYGGHGTLAGLIGAMQNAQQNANGGPGANPNGNAYNAFHWGEGSTQNDYTDNGNPALLKWQNQTDVTKTQRYLAKLGKMQTPAQDAEGYPYHQSAFQNMVIDQNLNAPVYAKLNASDFNTYCKQNGLTPIYRGWSGQASQDRFENAAMSHTGTGMYGEGYYFGDRGTAAGYGSTTTVAALSPSARVVDVDVLQKAIQASGATTQFNRSGYTPGSSYSPNQGEAQMALKMGYNVIRSSWNYCVLTRDAVVIKK